MARFDNQGAASGALSGAATGAAVGSVVPGVGTAIGAGVGFLGGGLMGGFMGGGRGVPDINIDAEMARINALYERARTEGSAAIAQDFQAQRGELAQSQAARGILRSGASQIGLQRLGAARQQALGAFNAQLSAAQAGQGSSLLNALLGRKTALDTAAMERRQQGQNQLFSSLSGLAGAFAASRGMNPGSAPQAGGFNFAGGNMVAPPTATTPQGFYQSEFGTSGFGGSGYSGSPTNWMGQGFR